MASHLPARGDDEHQKSSGARPKARPAAPILETQDLTPVGPRGSAARGRPLRPPGPQAARPPNKLRRPRRRREAAKARSPRRAFASTNAWPRRPRARRRPSCQAALCARTARTMRACHGAMPSRFARTPRATHVDENDQDRERRAPRAAVACGPVRVQGLRPLRGSRREPWTRPGPRPVLLYRGDGKPSPRVGDDENHPEKDRGAPESAPRRSDQTIHECRHGPMRPRSASSGRLLGRHKVLLMPDAGDSVEAIELVAAVVEAN